MAHQDYVSRSQAPNKKKSPYKTKEKDIPAPYPAKFKFAVIFIVIAIPAASYFLWSIKDRQPTPETKPVATEKNTEAATLPEPPKEKWVYRKELEQKQVEEGQYHVVDKGPYKMQCGSFRTRKQAEVLKANIAFSGLSAQISETSGKNGRYFKVFLGPYEKKRQAEKDKHKLKNNNINYCQIWLWK